MANPSGTLTVDAGGMDMSMDDATSYPVEPLVDLRGMMVWGDKRLMLTLLLNVKSRMTL